MIVFIRKAKDLFENVQKAYQNVFQSSAAYDSTCTDTQIN